jgi:short-subunit dehydrogenase
MKKVVIFGATGGLGNLISKKLVDYDVISLGSSDVDITNHIQVNEFFKNNSADIVINFAGVNFDKFAHKLTPNDKDIINIKNYILGINIFQKNIQRGMDFHVEKNIKYLQKVKNIYPNLKVI